MKPVTRRRRAHLNAELLYRIGKWNRRAYIGKQIIVAPTVQQVIGGISRTSLDRIRDRSRIILVPNCIRRRSGLRRPRKLNQGSRLTAIERKVDYTLVIEDGSDRVALRFDHPRVGLDLYGLHCRTDLQSYINRGVDVHLQHDSGLHVGSERLLGCLDLIRPNGQIGQPIDTIDPAFRGSCKTSLGLDNTNDSANDRRSAGILNRSADLGTSSHLCPKSGVYQQGEYNTTHRRVSRFPVHRFFLFLSTTKSVSAALNTPASASNPETIVLLKSHP